MDFNEGNESLASLTRTALRREGRMGLVFFFWGAAAAALAFFTATEESEQLGWLSWFFVIVIAWSIISGLGRLLISKATPVRSTWFPFSDGQATFPLSANARVQLLIVTADNGHELSWDIFGAELRQQREEGVAVRVDHVVERLVTNGLRALGVSYVPKTHGRRIYSWKLLRLRGTPHLLVRAKNKDEATSHRAQLLVIEI